MSSTVMGDAAWSQTARQGTASVPVWRGKGMGPTVGPLLGAASAG
ncbi:hypothetical protein SACE_4368 [Saccharopolyspora erythraea NRRL 2338]|uniref:Uncharacterized protein n=1 Tax=Saccharopolyspora erythraea (strain ATCC 11635 / DSM 40517 / JCM 4748 / NBRC 13426 / NCIMB 8594 / NRRL 2338) TaxID=405948 RepID=A4FHW2_SACEN|nr:hypothetical protein SACE_4368 [Saccharopolyspora erythraea NRRL 2338]